MARSPFSPSPSPEFEPTYFSDSSADDDYPHNADNGEGGQSASRPGSPMALDGQTVDEEGPDTMKCQWEDCSKIYNHLPSLIDHIHNGESHPPNLFMLHADKEQTTSVCTSRIIHASGKHAQDVE